MKKSDWLKQTCGLILLGFLISLGFIQPVQAFINIPQHVTLIDHQKESFPAMASVHSSNQEVVTAFSGKKSISVEGHAVGDSSMIVSVGHFPAKKVDVEVLPDIRLIPGGESIGVKLNSIGVLVVGFHLIHTTNGEESPAETAGLKIGDIITHINKQKVESMSDVKQLVTENGDHALDITILRDEKKKHVTLKPVKDQTDQNYRIGLYIRDSAAGIGTLTFYDPKSKKYGALGHVISDSDTKEPIQVHDGQVLRSEVTGIDKGTSGHPGEKIANFTPNTDPIGDITQNTPFGIYGKLTEVLKNGIYDKPMPIALSNEVKKGPAQILTVVNGQEVKAYDISIVNSVDQKFPATKGLVLKITDPRLLSKTGGIIQGMSGSPIIQDGKIIGAVTHVFVNDPTSGYGCHIEWMLQQAGIGLYQDQKEAS
ncbi:SpoIVB peptidase [Pullulanibacillus sp. KACC 23026]|uniref:SpoIVB peptidase n=1 Tax=Pullulanibacillus sp. KACC 23026 TaxID=3028315 RepID=UPI0023B030B8|nr:SpoIVB peptidase [Pullulanibacillus sp. KACC 23026]WEG14325.1 SpoIVB peptidase [Pullulanibacillus sp. KACC 23026]